MVFRALAITIALNMSLISVITADMQHTRVDWPDTSDEGEVHGTPSASVLATVSVDDTMVVEVVTQSDVF